MVIADDDRIDGRYLEVHQGILSLLALQAPVAGDLRLVAALLHVINHVERMGDQCVNIAKLVPLAGHEPPADDELLGNLSRMGELARVAGGAVQAGLRAPRRGAGARTWCARTTRSTGSTATSFHRALEIGDDPDTREWAMHMMLVARCLERIGDNAVDIGEQTAFVVTGLFREFEDASHPELRPGHCAQADVALFAGAPNHQHFFALFREAGANVARRPRCSTGSCALARRPGPARRDQVDSRTRATGSPTTSSTSSTAPRRRRSTARTSTRWRRRSTTWSTTPRRRPTCSASTRSRRRWSRPWS